MQQFLAIGRIVTLLLYNFLRRRREHLTLFKKLGIPGPEPHLLFGNTKGFRVKGIRRSIKEWTEEYGKIFGYYDGMVPTLVVADPDLVREITIKQFHKFHSRRPQPFVKRDSPRENIFTAAGEKWKRLRSAVSPSFTAKRMREMSPLINHSVDDLLKMFDKRCEEGKPFDIYSEFGRLTTDVISSCAFGIDAGCLKDASSPFLVQTRKVFEGFEAISTRVKIIIFLVTVFPDMVQYVRKIYPSFLVHLSGADWIYNMAKKMILERKHSQNKGNRIDVLNLMLSTNKEVGKEQIKVEKDEKDDYDKDGFLDADVNQLRKSQPMSIEEMMGQIVGFLLAGYETTSTALGFTAYELALNPDIQVKVQQEIDENYPGGDMKPNYNDLHKMKYMECILKEVLRIHPIGPNAVNRETYEEMTHGKITIPKGTIIRINMEALHFDPTLWGMHDPQKFVPERFLEDCQDTPNTLAWCPFGIGPRICIGMRFAVMEYKIALARLLKRYNIKKCPQTKVPCPTKKNGVFSPSEGVTIILERRN